MNKIREWGETYFVGDDGPLSCYDEFLTPIHITS
jgi:hypothetical protein